MNEYTWNEIIINPTSEDANNCIGKEVYASLSPIQCLRIANGNYEKKDRFFLDSINPDNNFPFYIKLVEAGNPNIAYKSFPCIILKDEELEPKYVPFKDYGEFIKYYVSSTSDNSLDSKIFSLGGIWLKQKNTNNYFMITGIQDDGVVLGNRKLKTTLYVVSGYHTSNDTTTWEELLNEYTFLNGSPCGKEVRTIHL